MTHDTRHVSGDTLDDVLAALPGDTTAFAVFVMHTLDPDATQVTIAERLHVSTPTVRRAWGRLRAVEAITCARSSDQPRAVLDNESDQPRAVGVSRTRGPSRAGDRSYSFSLFPSGTSDAHASESISALDATKRVFADKKPKPAQPFPAVLKIVQSLMAAGWSVDDVTEACLQVPTISTGWCESWLNKNRKATTNRNGDDNERRARPSRVVKL